MRTYECYDETSADYDTTRAAVGAEIVAGAMDCSARAASELRLLDVGCGSGNFSAALVDRVGRIDAIDMSDGMLGKARQKLAAAETAGRIAFHQGDIRSLPFRDATFDAAMVNQVLHHLESGTAADYPGHRKAIAEIHRVLRPGGILTIHFCDHDQLQDGFWFYHLIPRGISAALTRCASSMHLEAMFDDLGFEVIDRVVPKDQVLMGPAYFEGRGPLDQAWRNGDSIWALAPADELTDAIAKVESLVRDDSLDAYVAAGDADRLRVGQFTVVVARNLLKGVVVMEEAVTFYSEGYKLQGDVYAPDGLTPGETRAGVLLCHGYTGLKDLYLPETARALNAAGYVVLAFDYKGWGESEGPPYRLTPYSRVTDAHAALTFLGLRPEVDADRMGLFGWSYGGATVVWLAAHDARAKCVVSSVAPSHGARWLESVRTPEEWADLERRSEADREKRVLTGESERVPREIILFMDPDSKRLSGQSRKKTSAAAAADLPLEYVDETFGLNAEWVVEHISPRAVLFIACENDKVAPVTESQAMFECAGEPKKLVVIEGRGHYDAYFDDTFARVMDEATAWYGKHLAGD